MLCIVEWNLTEDAFFLIYFIRSKRKLEVHNYNICSSSVDTALSSHQPRFFQYTSKKTIDNTADIENKDI